MHVCFKKRQYMTRNQLVTEISVNFSAFFESRCVSLLTRQALAMRVAQPKLSHYYGPVWDRVLKTHAAFKR